MAKFDIEALLAPISDDTPSGPNLEYDLDFTSLEQAASPKAEKAMGDSVIAGEEPDWENVGSRAEALLGRTKDLRVALHMATAWLRLGGLEGGAAGLGLIRGIVENFWLDFHPQLDADDDDDPTFRVNSIAPLASLNGWLKYLRLTPFIASQRLGRFTLRDLRIANGTLKVPAKQASDDDDGGGQAAPPTLALIEGCCKDASLDLLAASAAAASLALEHAKAIDRAFTDKLGSAGPDLKNLVVECFELKKFLDPQLAARRPAAAAPAASPEADGDFGDDDDGESFSGSGGTRSGPVILASKGPIGGPEDVKRRLDEICDYYAAAEPSSPVPLLLRRAQRLVGRSFIELLQDLAPGGIAQVQVVSGPITAGGSSGGGAAPAAAAAASNFDDDD